MHDFDFLRSIRRVFFLIFEKAKIVIMDIFQSRDNFYLVNLLQISKF